MPEEEYSYIDVEDYRGDKGLTFNKVILNLLNKINARRIEGEIDKYIDGVDVLLVNLSGMIDLKENKKMKDAIREMDTERKEKLSKSDIKDEEFRTIELKYARNLHQLLIKVLQTSTDVFEVTIK